MSQKVSPILFNTLVYNNSKWFTKTNGKYALNEDLQIREIINILFKNNVNYQYFFVDKVVIYKYYSKIKIYVYFFCNFKYLKKNLLIRNKNYDKNYLNVFYLYYKYCEILNIKKIEILKLLSVLKYKNSVVQLYFKNLNYNLNSQFKMNKLIQNRRKNYLNNFYETATNNIYVTSSLYNYNFNNVNIYRKNTNINNQKKHYKKYFKKRYVKVNKYYLNLKYYKTIRFILYNLCYNYKFLNKLTAESLINIIYYELNKLDNAKKNYNFLFYNNFNLIRDQLTKYLKNTNCKIKGIRIQVKGRYFLTKRKRIFIFNLGNLNLNKIDYNKDYYCLHLIKSTGASSIKIWISYKD